ncbi:heme-binding domain-containing protein [Algoriphagus zhangzhouensis]|uniref:Haem-binding domain-containing protein n=1 Tax=Algoriphagus zhangzhouensis TaxID=1073327 RepID=A0A1M7Z5M6_9BACT|nr:heme-binding domain-containing protein [Algoriphagus zhangzhouensis]TDY48980.1 heme-binding protein [Algoriphagus zhangzhouensis]SHO60248.1 Haem-binding domain-containing protein [Algoriphagus zhangzhouensis]
MKVWQYGLLGLGIIFLVIQFVPNQLPEVIENNPKDLMGSGLVEGEMATLLKTACYDCHSNETKYPWYSFVAPASWLVAKDTREGREEVNFSYWTDIDMMDKLAILDDVYSEVEEKHMPLPIYLSMHSEAKLTPEDRQKIMEWAEAAMDIVVEEE